VGCFVLSAVLIKGVDSFGSKREDLAIKNGRFVDPREVEGLRGTKVIDALGLVGLPGFVDMHTHLREPGDEQAETILSGSQAAALGGFTSVHAMANTAPVADTAEAVTSVWEAGKSAGYVDVRPVGAVSRGLLGKTLSGMRSMAKSPAEVTVFSDDGNCVFDSRLMLQALQNADALGAVVAQHAEDPNLTIDSQMNEGHLAATLGLTGWPRVAEESMIARDVLLAEAVGARIHICHVSTAGSVEIISWAKKRGISVTAEVTPHHLLLTENLVETFNPLYKVNPPLRNKEDTVALREGVADGTIDIIATDHAPHSSERKEVSFPEAAFGMTGLETAFPVTMTTLVDTGLIELSDLARVMSLNPAQIARLRGYEAPLSVGSPAHLALLDPEGSHEQISKSLSKNNPYLNMSMKGRVQHTFFGGVQTVSDGSLVEIRKVKK